MCSGHGTGVAGNRGTGGVSRTHRPVRKVRGFRRAGCETHGPVTGPVNHPAAIQPCQPVRRHCGGYSGMVGRERNRRNWKPIARGCNAGQQRLHFPANRPWRSRVGSEADYRRNDYRSGKCARFAGLGTGRRGPLPRWGNLAGNRRSRGLGRLPHRQTRSRNSRTVRRVAGCHGRVPLVSRLTRVHSLNQNVRPVRLFRFVANHTADYTEQTARLSLG